MKGSEKVTTRRAHPAEHCDAEEEGEPIDYQDAVIGGRKVAIVPNGFPNKSLYREQGDLVRRELVGALDGNTDGCHIPCFDDGRGAVGHGG